MAGMARIVDPGELARAALPVEADLDGGPWDIDATDGDLTGGASAVGDDECLPPDFPEDEVAAAGDITFEHRRGDRLVHATSTVFATPAAAGRAVAMLEAEPFVRCFMTSVAATVEVAPPVELLGPVVAPQGSCGWRAVLAAVEDDAVSSITVDVGVLRRDVVVVLVWSVRSSSRGGDQAWDRLIERARHRCDEAVGSV